MATTAPETAAGGIGQVESQFFTFGSEQDPFTLEKGGKLDSVTLAYETYGELNEARDNAILIFHALSGSQHAAGTNPAVEGIGELWTKECKQGWWDEFIGSGRAINTDKFCAICVNYLGGCYGSSGPGSINPATGNVYGSSFPQVTITDMVRSQVRLLDHLGIEQLHGVVGGSLGGMMCLAFATHYPERVRIVAPIATGHYVTSLQRITNFEQIFALERDPHFKGGDYYDGPRPEAGVIMARMISHKTFVSLSTLERRARKEVVQHKDDFGFYHITHPIESYMHHQGGKFTRRFDANTYLRILDAWQTFSLTGHDGDSDLIDIFATCRNQRYMVIGIDSDVCFYPDQQKEMTAILRRAGVPYRHITIHSGKGHDAFLLEANLLAPTLSDAFEGAWG